MIELTTPVATGDLDPNGPYTQVKIVGYRVDVLQRAMFIRYQAGNTVKGEWRGGLAPAKEAVAVDHTEDGEPVNDFTDLVSKETEAGLTAYEQDSKNLYQYLLDKKLVEGKYA